MLNNIIPSISHPTFVSVLIIKQISMKNTILTFSLFLMAMVSNQVYSQNEIQIGSPEITFEKSEHDYGVIDQYGNGEYEFKFTNTGSAPLLIKLAKGTCGCTVPEWSREPIQPGASSSILVRYDTKRVGVFAKGVTITANTEPSITNIKIKGEVKASTSVSPLKPASVPATK